MKTSEENLCGRVVISGDGRAIGRVKHLLVDTTNWSIESLQIELRKESAERIGKKHGIFHSAVVEIPARLIRSVSDTVVLTIDLDELRTQDDLTREPAPAPGA